jgi:hypothetical protein
MFIYLVQSELGPSSTSQPRLMDWFTFLATYGGGQAGAATPCHGRLERSIFAHFFLITAQSISWYYGRAGAVHHRCGRTRKFFRSETPPETISETGKPLHPVKGKCILMDWHRILLASGCGLRPWRFRILLCLRLREMRDSAIACSHTGNIFRWKCALSITA